MMRVPLLPALLVCLLAAGCASLPNSKPDRRDPLERYNRWMFGINDAVDRAAVKPVAQAYVRVVPPPVRRGVGNFFHNISYPRTIVNDLLQAKVADGTRDTARLVVNSVLGLGFFDPATQLGLDRHDEDFGQTLGRWGVPSGPYLMLPVLGPSTVRDAIGRVPDEYSSGRHYIKDSALKWSLAALDAVDQRAGLLQADSATRETFDRYAFIRNAWLQRREFLVRDGNVDEPAFDAEPPADQPISGPAPRPTR
jgi:phospholipid-binding lipoprotein MlaA